MRYEDFATMIDTFMQDDSEWASDRRARWMAGCNVDDTTDGRGEKLRPRRNEAGEPCWM